MVLSSATAKSTHLYLSLCDHLHTITFYDHVTRLDLETRRGELKISVKDGLRRSPNVEVPELGSEIDYSSRQTATAHATERRYLNSDSMSSEVQVGSQRSESKGSLYLKDEADKKQRQWFEREPIVIILHNFQYRRAPIKLR
jgi:hypothetical protein